MDEIKDYEVIPMDQGLISGINGLILGLATKMQLQGICLLGETHGYQTATGQYLLDAKAVKAVLEVLTKMLNISIDMEPIDKQTEQMDEFITKMTKIENKNMEEMYNVTDKSKRYIT
jgi:proteasome assembly chaperone (PAC2) family protein